MSIGELLALKRRIWKEQFASFCRYGRKSFRFALCDLSYGLWGLFSNPYRVCRRFLEKRGEEEVYAYGETPLSTLEKIVTQCQITSQDHWLELGSGRGKGCLWMEHFVGCQVTGVEWIAAFVRQSRFLASLYGFKQATFLCQDFAEAPFRKATVVYLYGTCLPEAQIASLLRKMETMAIGTKVITVSAPLVSSSFRLERSFSVWYPWGRTNAYLHRKKS